MIYVILYILLVYIIYLFYSFVERKQLKKLIGKIHYDIEKMGFDYVSILQQNWNKIYKNDKDTANLMYFGRTKFFNGKRHRLKNLMKLYKSYDFEYLEKLFGKKIEQQGYKDLEKKFGEALGTVGMLKALRKILVVMSLGILHFFISSKKYA